MRVHLPGRVVAPCAEGRAGKTCGLKIIQGGLSNECETEVRFAAFAPCPTTRSLAVYKTFKEESLKAVVFGKPAGSILKVCTGGGKSFRA